MGRVGGVSNTNLNKSKQHQLNKLSIFFVESEVFSDYSTPFVSEERYNNIKNNNKFDPSNQINILQCYYHFNMTKQQTRNK